jgi:hypothetical protein
MSVLCQKQKYAAQQKGRLFDHLALVLTSRRVPGDLGTL